MLKLWSQKHTKGHFHLLYFYFPKLIFINILIKPEESRGNLKLLCSWVFGKQERKIKKQNKQNKITKCHKRVENCSHGADVEYNIAGLVLSKLLNHESHRSFILTRKLSFILIRSWGISDCSCYKWRRT